MNNDTRLAVGTHILAVLALTEGEHQTSELLARSVNTNPVVIRRLLSQLKKAGLVDVRLGIGGAALNLPPEKISLLDVYKAVVPTPTARPFFLHQNPSAKCVIGKNIHDALAAPFSKVNEAMQESLAATSIADIARFITSRLSEASQK